MRIKLFVLAMQQNKYLVFRTWNEIAKNKEDHTIDASQQPFLSKSNHKFQGFMTKKNARNRKSIILSKYLNSRKKKPDPAII